MKTNTICVQGGWQPKNGEARVLPIYQSTTFKYDTSEEMGKLFDLEAEGYFYSRLQNPTCDMVAKKICDLEGGVAAMLTSSGQAATLLAVANICEAGSHVICASKVYGGTSNLLAVTLKRFGIETSLVDQDLPAEELETYFRPNTRAVFAETVSNPSGVVLDIDKFVSLAHSHGVPMICDNTFATPINCQPFKFGVDIITHSTTKYMDGHAMAMGGCIVDRWNYLYQEIRKAGIYPEGYGAADARYGSLPVPHERISHQRGSGDAASAGAPPLRERSEGGRIPGKS